MNAIGAILNAVTIVIASIIGVQLKTGIPQKVQDTVMKAVALSILAIGIDGIIQGENTMVLILSVIIGALVGEWIDFDQLVRNAMSKFESRLAKNGKGSSNQLTQAMLSASMIFCIGSMAIVGSLESGLTGNNATLYTKSILDGITAVLLSSTLGIGVALSAIPVLLIQGSLTLFAVFLEPVLAADIVTEIIAVGSVLLVGLGLNMLDITQLKIMNFVPAIVLPVILMQFM